MAALCSMSMLVEIAGRQRIATKPELDEIREAWPNIRGFIGIDATCTATHSTDQVLRTAMPELSQQQPRDIPTALGYSKSANIRPFSQSLATFVGARELDRDLKGLDWNDLLEAPRPILFTDRDGEGGCCVCGKTAQLERCRQCARLMHLSCAANRRKPEPPICSACLVDRRDEEAPGPH